MLGCISSCVVCMWWCLFVYIHIHNPIKQTTPIDDVWILFLISNVHSFFIFPHLHKHLKIHVVIIFHILLLFHFFMFESYNSIVLVKLALSQPGLPEFPPYFSTSLIPDSTALVRGLVFP